MTDITIWADASWLDSIGPALAGGGLSGLFLAIINGWFSDRDKQRDHEYRKAALVARADANTEAIGDLYDYVEELEAWAAKLTTTLLAHDPTKPMAALPHVPAAPDRPVWPSLSHAQNPNHSGGGLPPIGSGTSPA